MNTTLTTLLVNNLLSNASQVNRYCFYVKNNQKDIKLTIKQLSCRKIRGIWFDFKYRHGDYSHYTRVLIHLKGNNLEPVNLCTYELIFYEPLKLTSTEKADIEEALKNLYKQLGTIS